VAKRKKAPKAAELARARFHELVGELRRLTVAFPELHEAMDDDDLPIRFLIRRGADRARDRAARKAAEAAAEGRPPKSPSAARRTMSSAASRQT
jgi:hypothetical protein